jgi:ribosomal protein S18 acetylase RimI-like enzyme
MSDLRIRPWRESDEEFFLEMGVVAAQMSLTPAEVTSVSEAELRQATLETDQTLLNCDGMAVFIAENQERQRVGALWLGPRTNPLTRVTEAWIYSIAVVPEFQGSGVGRAMMDFAETWAREHGYPSLGLMVSATNDRARGIYARRGYEDVTVLMRKPLP